MFTQSNQQDTVSCFICIPTTPGYVHLFHWALSKLWILELYFHLDVWLDLYKCMYMQMQQYQALLQAKQIDSGCILRKGYQHFSLWEQRLVKVESLYFSSWHARPYIVYFLSRENR